MPDETTEHNTVIDSTISSICGVVCEQASREVCDSPIILWSLSSTKLYQCARVLQEIHCLCSKVDAAFLYILYPILS